MNAQDRERIRQIMQERNIQRIFHFTPIQNLNSILENGLYSHYYIVNDPDENNIIIGHCLDRIRADGRIDGICLSLEFPNDIMLYKRMKDYDTDWVLIGLDINLILEIQDRQIQFFQTNAANARFRNIDNASLETAMAFEGLFADAVSNKRDGILYRPCNLPAYYPTDVQAEIMITRHIEKKYIQAVIFNNQNLCEYYQTKYPSYTFHYSNYWFGWRDNTY